MKYNKFLDERLLGNVRNKCNLILSKQECSYEMFDDALVVIYAYLENEFNEFRKEEEYNMLLNNLNLNSYLQYKMCSSTEGL